MSVIVSTKWCYEAYHTKEKCWYVGDSFKAEDGFDIETIRWSETGWEDECTYFMEFLNKEIERYETRYHTRVTHLALAGSVGRWNHNPIGGKILTRDENPLEHMGKVEIVEIYVDSEDILTILGHHHDGTHRMHIYLLTSSKIKKISRKEPREFYYQEFEKIYNALPPLKLTKQGRQYYNPNNQES